MNSIEQMIAEIESKIEHWHLEAEISKGVSDAGADRAVMAKLAYKEASKIIKKHTEGMVLINSNFLEATKCPNSDCDNDGTIAVQIDYNEWEPQQCQWCHEKQQVLSASGEDNENAHT